MTELAALQQKQGAINRAHDTIRTVKNAVKGLAALASLMEMASGEDLEKEADQLCALTKAVGCYVDKLDEVHEVLKR